MARFYLLLFISILFALLSTSVSRTVIESSSSTPPLLIKLVGSDSSSSLSDTLIESKITIGSSISAAGGGAGASFWPSPSGIFSFGFYPLNSYNEEYIIGIWINNNPNRKTLVWWINLDDSPLSNTTSLLLNHDGKFVIQFSNGTKEKPLFHQTDSLLSSPISHAYMLDNGNLVFYNLNSTIIWESFDYPTDTILSGQTLHSKQSIVSNGYRLIMKDNGNLMVYTIRHYHKCTGIYVLWETNTQMKNGSPIELKLDSTGHLYLEDWNGLIKKNLYKDDKQQPHEYTIHRATLGRDGVFRLYKEKIDGNASPKEEKEIHTLVWDTQNKFSQTAEFFLFEFLGLIAASMLSLFVYIIWSEYCQTRPDRRSIYLV